MKHFPNQFSRRAFLKTGAASLGILALTPIAALAAQSRNRLKIPPLDGGMMIDGKRQFDLQIRHGQSEFFAGVKTETMGINGDYLGPVLRFRAGESVRLNVQNDLNENTTLHWHGFNLPARSDGGPHQVVEPGDNWTAQFDVREKAATMWYHSHLLHKTADQVWAGIAGMIIVDDDEGDALNLPQTYGVDDIPVVLQDRSFSKSGQIPYRPGMASRAAGMTGDTALVNGTVAAFFDVTTSLVRLRLLNGANGSIYTLGFADGREFRQIASDGGLLSAPVAATLLRLAPGERAEIIVDMSDQRPAILRNFATRSGGMGAMMGSRDPDFEFLELRPVAGLVASSALPARLANMPAPQRQSAMRTRLFELQMNGLMMLSAFTRRGFTINDKSMKISRIDEVVKRGETEIWQIANRSMMAHPLHIHNTQFRILDRNGAPPHAGESGYKDTVLIDAGETVNILIRFDNYTDPDRPYMYHCHILEHEDAGMMGQFTVV